MFCLCFLMMAKNSCEIARCGCALWVTDREKYPSNQTKNEHMIKKNNKLMCKWKTGDKWQNDFQLQSDKSLICLLLQTARGRFFFFSCWSSTILLSLTNSLSLLFTKLFNTMKTTNDLLSRSKKGKNWEIVSWAKTIGQASRGFCLPRNLGLCELWMIHFYMKTSDWLIKTLKLYFIYLSHDERKPWDLFGLYHCRCGYMCNNINISLAVPNIKSLPLLNQYGEITLVWMFAALKVISLLCC